MNKGRIIWFTLIALVIIIQFIPSGRPRTIEANPDDLLVNNPMPDSVTRLLKAACYDCHSNQSRYPWYAYVAPVSWLVSRDVRIGREQFNFSHWETYSKMDQAKILGEMADEIESGTMPMPIYVLMHPDAKLSAAERDKLIWWTDEYSESLFE